MVHMLRNVALAPIFCKLRRYVPIQPHPAYTLLQPNPPQQPEIPLLTPPNHCVGKEGRYV